LQSRPQLDLDQFAEIGNKMFLRAKVTSTEPFQVGIVKLLKLQA
jgi:hypothetical protein